MSAIEPGVWVECVDDAPRGFPSRVQRGCVYQVNEVVRGGAGITLIGVDPFPFAGWWINRFRPIWRGPQSLIQDLLQPIPADNQRENA